ncbi:carboxymuconolactone decarboxylase family protein [Arsenicicoccus bolidensis]|uniref:Carboxymuconolactone decarboxylase family protein n=1 Tax=Arsenicicoccus bolidensis TaxID=229480 RepID=A0ABS9Q3A8_9MICO|nr:carboxymuconolactone decarboxylase family protein [Arsenicicoccus bolidensis]MCG7322364.1 carboxymuconolactone decarboxylase family protein [Arsenicicoccus bolidensis]
MSVSAGQAGEAVADRAARGRRTYAHNLGLDEPGVEAAMGEVVGSAFVREAYVAAGGPGWHSPDLTDRDRALVIIAAMVGQHVTDERLQPYLELARKEGVSEDGLDAVMILMAAYVGQPAASRGAAAVHRQPSRTATSHILEEAGS